MAIMKACALAPGDFHTAVSLGLLKMDQLLALPHKRKRTGTLKDTPCAMQQPLTTGDLGEGPSMGAPSSHFHHTAFKFPHFHPIACVHVQHPALLALLTRLEKFFSSGGADTRSPAHLEREKWLFR